MKKFMDKSNRLLRRFFRIMLIGMFAFIAFGCPTPDYGVITPDYGVGVPAYGVPYSEESTVLEE
jgi:hypothetical protein